MLSKLLRPVACIPKNILVARKIIVARTVPPCRTSSDMLPPTQYDMPIPKKFHLSYALRVYWEIIPLFLVTMTSLAIMFFSIAWACKNKVDVVFTTHNRRYISRTMDLRNPSVHKLVIINQRYEPWPEMQDVLDKMVTAEKRALVRMQSCAHA